MSGERKIWICPQEGRGDTYVTLAASINTDIYCSVNIYEPCAQKQAKTRNELTRRDLEIFSVTEKITGCREKCLAHVDRMETEDVFEIDTTGREVWVQADTDHFGMRSEQVISLCV